MKRMAAITLLTCLSPLSWSWAAGPDTPPSPDAAELRARAQGACGADFEKFCPAADDPREHIECLIRNESQLSLDCATFLNEAKRHSPPPAPGVPSPSKKKSESTAPAGK